MSKRVLPGAAGLLLVFGAGWGWAETVVHWEETPQQLIKVMLEDGKEVGRWVFPKREISWRTSIGEDLETLIELAEDALERRKYQHSVKLFELALERAQEAGEAEEGIVEILSGLARANASQGNMVFAELFHKRVVSMRRRIHGSYAPVVAESLERLAKLYLDMGRLRDARPVLEEARRIRRAAPLSSRVEGASLPRRPEVSTASDEPAPPLFVDQAVPPELMPLKPVQPEAPPSRPEVVRTTARSLASRPLPGSRPEPAPSRPPERNPSRRPAPRRSPPEAASPDPLSRPPVPPRELRAAVQPAPYSAPPVPPPSFFRRPEALPRESLPIDPDAISEDLSPLPEPSAHRAQAPAPVPSIPSVLDPPPSASPAPSASRDREELDPSVIDAIVASAVQVPPPPPPKAGGKVDELAQMVMAEIAREAPAPRETTPRVLPRSRSPAATSGPLPGAPRIRPSSARSPSSRSGASPVVPGTGASPLSSAALRRALASVPTPQEKPPPSRSPVASPPRRKAPPVPAPVATRVSASPTPRTRPPRRSSGPGPLVPAHVPGPEEEKLLATLADQERELGKDHPNLSGTLLELAELYEREGRKPEAVEPYLRSLAMWERALGKDHPELTRLLNNIANLYLDLGDLVEAEAYFWRAMGIRERLLGRDHPDVARLMSNLAYTYYLRGDGDSGRGMIERARKSLEAALGGDHPGLAWTLAVQGMLEMANGQRDQARKLFERSLDLGEKRGVPDPELLEAYARLLRQEGESERARKLEARREEVLASS